LPACSRTPLEEEVLEAIRPTPLQLKLLGSLYRLLESKLSSCARLHGLDAVVEAEGSYAKGTLTRDKWELDVFLLVRGASREWIASQGERLLRECLEGLPVEARYAEHPYVTVRVMGMEADVVIAPLVSKPGEGGTGVERTPFHTRWVRRALRGNPCLADDIRLFKSFLKGIGAYGAEVRVGGFSGLLAEILVVYHGGFRRLIEAASRWRPGVYVDPLGIGDEELLRRRYPESPIIVPDPVDPGRNAAASVTRRKLASLVLAANAYLEAPCRLYYHPYSTLEPPPYRPDPRRILAVELRGDYSGLARDALWGRLSRMASWLSRGLSRAGFGILRWEVWTDESSRALIALELESPELPALELAEGPPAWEPARALRFTAKRAGESMPVAIDDEGRLKALRPRRHTTARSAAEHLLGSGQAPLPRGTASARVVEPGDPGLGEAVRLLAEATPRWPYCLAR